MIFFMLVLGSSLNDTKSSGDKANLGNPKANRGFPPSTVNRTSAECVQNSGGPPSRHIELGNLILGGSTVCQYFPSLLTTQSICDTLFSWKRYNSFTYTYSFDVNIFTHHVVHFDAYLALVQIIGCIRKYKSHYAVGDYYHSLWRLHNREGFSFQRSIDCLLSSLFRLTTTKLAWLFITVP